MTASCYIDDDYIYVCIYIYTHTFYEAQVDGSRTSGVGIDVSVNT